MRESMKQETGGDEEPVATQITEEEKPVKE